MDFFHEEVLTPRQIMGYRQLSDLQGAIGRPQTAAYYDESADLVRIAAYYWHGIALSHGYVDGNKRTAFTSMTTFRLMNGLEFVAPDYALGPWIENLFETDRFDLDVLDTLIRTHARPLTD
nr:type II toxin-antitoxin system death-on-curing family toxin [Paracoccus lutimaris]